MFCFALSAFLYTVVPNPYWLFPVRVIAGIAGRSLPSPWPLPTLATSCATQIVVPPFQLFTTAMGIGFTIFPAPALGGSVATYYGYRGSYRLAVLIGLVGMVIVWALRDPKTATTAVP